MYRLIYKSRCTGAISRDMIREILHESSEMNRSAGITGALLATDRYFMQVLEGEYNELNETFFRIAADPRHSKIELIHFGPAASRLFEGWAMKGIGIFDLNRELEDELKKKYGEDNGSVCIPSEEWAALAMAHDVQMMSYSCGH